MRSLLTALVLTALPAFAASCPSGYSYSRPITVNAAQITGTLTNFPMLVLNPTSGAGNPNNTKTTSNGGHVTSANGYDIVFTDSIGTILPFELVGHGTAAATWDATTGNGEWWVNVTSIANGSSINLCYGNAAITTYQGNDSATWNSSYVAVLHHGTASMLSLNDSTGINTATNVNAAAAGTGPVDGGATFASASSQKISLGTNPALNPSAITYYSWFKPTSFKSAYSNILAKVGGAAYSEILITSAGKLAIYVRGVGTVAPFNCSTGGINDVHYDSTGSHTISAGTWYQVATTYDSSAGVKGYVNGALDGSGGPPAGVLCPNPGATEEGASSDGVIDEVQIAKVALSADWIAAEYKNQANPGAFYTVGSEASTLSDTSMTVAPVAIPNGHPGNITLTLTGTGTNWSNANTVFTIAGVSNVTKVSQNVGSATAATLVVATGAGTGSLNISESVTGSASTTTVVGVPSFSIDVVRGNLSSVQTLALTGTNTVWNQEAAGLFSVAGGLGANIGTPAISTNTTGTVQLTVGTSAGPLTITDASTGKTATFTAGGAAGPSGCTVVLSQ